MSGPLPGTGSGALRGTEERILSVAVEVLGANPEAGIGEVAAAAGVVRRTVYGYFRTRADLVRALTRLAAGELETALVTVDLEGRSADAVWVDFIGQVWPLAHRYRVLVALRRGEFGPDIHALLGPVDTSLTALVRRGQGAGAFGRHLPAEVLAQVAWSVVFSVADHARTRDDLDARSAVVTSLLVLGVAQTRAVELVAGGEPAGDIRLPPGSPPR